MGRPNYEVLDLGPEHPDYFVGFGVSFTKYRACVVGIGNNASEAYDDALSMMYDVDPDLTARMPRKIKGIRKNKRLTKQQSESGWFYYVGIRWV